MRSFKDTQGRAWNINLTISTVKRIKDSELGIDLLKWDSEGESPVITQLAMDIVLLCDVIYVCIQPQADKEGVSSEQFGEALGGDVILAARNAFFEELADFFQSLGRKVLVRAIKAQEKMIQAAMDRADQKLETVDLDKLVDKAMDKAFGDRFTNMQDS